MSFGTYARRTRDRDLPYWARYCALRCAVGHYRPVGFHATWSFLGTVGDLKKDEVALTRALDVLETSRAVWLAELDAFAARRRVEKQQHRRMPTALDRLRLRGYRWPGPDGHAAVLRTVDELWERCRGQPFPETPVETTGDLVYLDSTVADCVSNYLNSEGELTAADRDLLLACLAPLRMQIQYLGYPRMTHPMAFQHFLRLHKLGELVVNDVSDRLPPAAPEMWSAGRSRSGPLRTTADRAL